MFEVGRVCIKLAGRDAAKKCVVVEIIDDRFVMIDGETRRRKCNILHLEPLMETLSLKKGASSADVRVAFKKFGIEIKETKPKKAGPRPLRIRKSVNKEKLSEKKQAKDVKKTENKEEVKKPVKADNKEKADAKVKKAPVKKKVSKEE